MFVLGAEIKQYVMSCRVLGMDIENAVLHAVCENLRANGAEDVLANVMETPSNMPCRLLYRSVGFKDDVGSGIYRLPGTMIVEKPAHVSLVWR